MTSLEKEHAIFFITHRYHPGSQIPPKWQPNNLNNVNMHGIWQYMQAQYQPHLNNFHGKTTDMPKQRHC